MRRTKLINAWRYVWPILPPLALCALAGLILHKPVMGWLYGEDNYDKEAIAEWVRDARPLKTLPELAGEYLERKEKHQQAEQELDEVRRRNPGSPEVRPKEEVEEQRRTDLEFKRKEIAEHLKALGMPPTKMFPNQLPLFPVIYRLTLKFAEDDEISWDSELPRQKNQSKPLTVPLTEADYPAVMVEYHLHAYTQRQARERSEVARRLVLSGVGGFAAVLALVWVYVVQRRARERQRRHAVAEQEISEARRRQLEEELRRQEAERQKDEAQRQALELKSQLFANIGIMAGSYAHNIKNLLVRPNDLLRRCLDDRPNAGDQQQMLHEVRQTLGTVTERLQQILRTVNRDPTQSERVRIDLNALVADIQRTWSDLARERWKMAVHVDLGPCDAAGAALPLWIEGDPSHLQQVLENLLTNARDATFEMRNQLREQARAKPRGASSATSGGPRRLEDSPAGLNIGGDGESRPADAERRQALIAAAAWKGEVRLRTRREDNHAVLEVQDNGVGMPEEVRRRCTETHFSTKRNNALFAGLSAGMGLGLSFVTVILNHHHAQLEVDSEPGKGATFRVRFPAAAEVSSPTDGVPDSARPGPA